MQVLRFSLWALVLLMLVSCGSEREKEGSASDRRMQTIMFYDSDNGCSLGCACDWTVIQPNGAFQIGQDENDEDDDDEDEDNIVFTKSIGFPAGSEIGFQLRGIKGSVEFSGFSIEAGSYDGKQDCTRPRKYMVLINHSVVMSGELANTQELQSISVNRVPVKNDDVVSIRFDSGFDERKIIGVTYLAPDGAH